MQQVEQEKASLTAERDALNQDLNDITLQLSSINKLIRFYCIMFILKLQ